MKKEHLLENETVLVNSDDDSVILTNLRILRNLDLSGEGYFISMQLQNISTIEINSRSFPWLLSVGIIGALIGTIAGINAREDAAIYGSIFLGLVFIILYFLTRYHVITVSSNGGSKLYFKTKGMKKENVLDFVRKIDQAKNLIPTKI